MVTGKKPTISVLSVRDALDGLLYASKPPAEISALQALTLVDEFISNPDLPHFENIRSFAVTNLLTDLISREISHLRQSINRTPPKATTPLDVEIEAIRSDGHTRAVPLIAWSYLYYRYVRVDLNLSPEEYAEIVQVDVRTLRRYQTRALEALTEKLVIEEWKARIRLRKRRLYNALPIIPTVKLFGRDNAFEIAKEALTRGYKQFYITGASGIGKTVFAQELVRRLIESPVEPFVENVVWLSTPVSKDSLLNEIHERICPEDGSMTLRDCLAQYRTVIVIDDVSLMNVEALENALAYLSAAEVICTSPTYAALRSNIIHIPMTELSLEETTAYIRWLIVKEVDYVEDIDAIFREVGGNPLAIKMVVNALSLDPSHTLAKRSTRNLYEREFELFPENLKRAWMLCVFLPPHGLKREKIAQVCKVSSGEIATLLAHNVVTADIHHRITMSQMARQIIEVHYKSSDELQRLFNDALFEMETRVNLQDEEDIGIIEYLLTQEVVNLPPEWENHWLELLLKHPRSHRSSSWLNILDRRWKQDRLQDLRYVFEYGRMLRQFHQWEKAQLILEDVIIKTGNTGDFTLQTQAMLQLALLFRSAGIHQKAAKLLREAEKLAVMYKQSALVDQIHLEKAQIAVDEGDAASALEILEKVSESRRTSFLRAEVFLLAGQYEVGIQEAKRALALYTHDRLYASLTSLLLGQLHTASQNYEAAHKALLFSVNLLETLKHPLALARAWTNLAVVYVYEGERQQARELLLKAEQIQTQIRDEVGLAFTRYNLRRVDDVP